MFAPFCLHCSRQSGPLDDLIAVAHFEGIAREAVHVLKYHGRHAIAGLMGRLMAGVAREVEVDCVAPIPLHSTRLRERGYDQAALLARSVAHALALPHQGKALKRVRATRQQVTLDALARQANVAGAFASPRRRQHHGRHDAIGSGSAESVGSGGHCGTGFRPSRRINAQTPEKAR
jgi:predicted amidophosphoribosyltransferase